MPVSAHDSSSGSGLSTNTAGTTTATTITGSNESSFKQLSVKELQNLVDQQLGSSRGTSISSTAISVDDRHRAAAAIMYVAYRASIPALQLWQRATNSVTQQNAAETSAAAAAAAEDAVGGSCDVRDDGNATAGSDDDGVSVPEDGVWTAEALNSVSAVGLIETTCTDNSAWDNASDAKGREVEQQVQLCFQWVVSRELLELARSTQQR